MNRCGHYNPETLTTCSREEFHLGPCNHAALAKRAKAKDGAKKARAR